MQKLRIVIIEDDKDFSNCITAHFESQYADRLQVVGVADNGKQGCELVFSVMPDVVLIDAILPIQDGESVLRHIKSNRLTRHMVCIMMSSTSSELTAVKMLEMGADYYLIKPFGLDKLAGRILYLYEYKSSAFSDSIIGGGEAGSGLETLAPEDFIPYSLQQAGIPMHLNGYAYFSCAVRLCAENGDLLNAMTKELYPRVGTEFKTTGARVERCMRNAIEKAWAQDGGKKYRILTNAPEEKPANGAFIAEMTELFHKYHK